MNWESKLTLRQGMAKHMIGLKSKYLNQINEVKLCNTLF